MQAWVLLAACGVAAATYEYDLVQGDIQVEVERLPDGTRRRMGSALGATPIGGHDNLWDLGRVNYYIETVAKNPGATDPLAETEPRIQAAVTEWESKTCIRLTRCGTEAGCAKPYIRFMADAPGTCNSPVGVASSKVNQINLGVKCGAGTIVHEIAHSLGISHEQSRKDRDDYVTIDTAEITAGKAHNFAQNTDPARDIGPYDYSSIMHYSATAFAKGSKPTIISPQPIGARAGLSAGDVAAIEFMYHGCSAGFAAPTCVASVDVSAAHVIPHTHAWTVEFNALYATGKTMTVTYPGTTAPPARVQYATASGSNLGNAGFARVEFSPSVGDGGNTFKLSATFTGSDGPAVTCSVDVAVASADKVCFGLASNDPKVCSGRGVCGTDRLAPCTCEAGYGGLDCSGFATCPSNYQWSFDIDEGTWSPSSVSGSTADFFAAGGGSLKLGEAAGPATRGSAGVSLVELSKPARATFYLAWIGGTYGPSVNFNRKVDAGTTHFCWSMRVHLPHKEFVARNLLTGKSVETDRFYFIDVRFNWAASTADLYVDGTLLKAGSTFDNACSEGMNRVSAFGNGWVDEFNLWCTNYVTLTGSLAAGASQTQLQAGGATATLTLVGDHDTWVDTAANRQAVVDALVADVALPAGWNALRATMLDASLVSISGQVLTLGPLRAAPGFSAEGPQTVTVLLTGSMFTSGVAPASGAHELQFTVSGGCSRGLHVAYDDTPTAIKHAGAGSHALTDVDIAGGSSRTRVRLHASELVQPEVFSLYVRTTDVNAKLWLRIASAADVTLDVRHSWSGQLAVKTPNGFYTLVGPTAINTFQKVMVTFNWAAGTYVLSLDGDNRHTGTLPFTDVAEVYIQPDILPGYVDEVTFSCPARKPLYALNTAGCVDGATAVTVRVTEGSESLGATDKIAIVPGTATDCLDAETKCGVLNACSTTVGSLTKVLSEVHWAAGTLSTLPAGSSYKVCYFLASRGTYELLDNTFTSCAAAATPPTYALSPAACVDGATAVTVQVSKGSETLSTTDKLAIVPGTATDCVDAETKCGVLNGCSTGAALMLMSDNLHWAAGALATLPTDAPYKVCHFLASRGTYELLAGDFRTCVPPTPPTYALSPAACVDGATAVTVQVSKGSETLSTTDKLAIVPGTATDCVDAETKCGVLNGCSTGAALMLMSDNLHWAAGALATLPTDAPYKVCHFLASRGTYELLAGDFRTCVPPTPPTYALSPAACVDGATAVTVQVSKGSETLSTTDKLAIVPGTATDCVDAETKCGVLNGCSTGAALMLMSDNLHWAAGALATLPTDAPYKVCHFLASRGTYELLAGDFRTCVPPTPPTYALSPAACVDGATAVTVQVSKGSETLSTTDKLAIVPGTATDCVDAETKCGVLNGCSTGAALMLMSDNLHWAAGALATLPTDAPYKVCHFLASRGTYELLAGDFRTCVPPTPPTYALSPAACVDGATAVTVQVSKGSETLSTTDKLAIVPGTATDCVDAETKCGVLNGCSTGAALMLMSDNLHWAAGALATLPTDAPYKVCHFLASRGTYELLAGDFRTCVPPTPPTYALSPAACVDGATAVTVQVSKGSETLSTTDKLAIVPGTATDCVDAETKCGVLNGCSTGAALMLMSDNLHWAAGALATLPTDAPYKVCHFLASRGTYELLAGDFRTCVPPTPPTYALSPAACVDGATAVTVQVSKGSETLSTTDKLAIVPGTATDCVDAETKCGVLNGCSTGAALMLMSDNLHWAAGALATLPTDAPYKVCHFLASRGTYELLAGDFRTCVPPTPPTYALSPAACVDGATAVTVQVSKGSETLSTTDKLAIVPGTATDCVDAETKCGVLNGCSTGAALMLMSDNLHWAAGALATLPTDAPYKVCHFLASRGTYELLAGDFRTCVAPPTYALSPAACVDGATAVTVQVSKGSETLSTTDKLAIVPGTATDCVDAETKCGVLNGCSTGAALMLMSDNLHWAAGALATLPTDAPYKVCHFLASRGTYELLAGDFRTCVPPTPPTYALSPAACVDGATAVTVQVSKGSETLSTTDKLAIVPGTATDCVDAETKCGVLNGCSTGAALMLMSDNLHWAAGALATLPTDAPYKVCHFLASRGTYELLAGDFRTCVAPPTYALSPAACVDGATAVTVQVSKGSETLSTTDKLAIVPGTATDCVDAETKCGVLNGCSTGAALMLMSDNLHWAAGALATLPTDAPYKVCHFLASRGTYELLAGDFRTCVPPTPPTYALSPAACVDGATAVTVQVSKGSETLSTTDKLAIVPGTATDCVDAETKCGVLNGCSTGAALMLMSDNLHWAAGALATLPTDAPYKVCHFLASRGTYELLAGDFRTCVPPTPPTYALSPAACVDGATAVTVQVSKGSETLSTTDKLAIVPGTATDCVDAETKCGVLNGCSTGAALMLMSDNLHWAAGALATLPTDAPYKVCHFLASRGTYELLAGDFRTCVPPTPPTYALSPAACVDGATAVTVQVSKGSETLSTTDKLAIVPGTATDCVDAETKCGVLNGCSTGAALMLMSDNLHWAAGALATLPTDAPYKVCHFLASRGTYELLAGDFRTCVAPPTYALSPAACVDGATAVTVQVSKGSETLSTTDKLAIVPGTATDCVDAETKCGVLNGCSTGAALMLMSDNLHWAAGALATLPTDAPYKVCHFLASRGTYELLAGDFRTCVPPTPPTYALSPAACVDGATAVTVQVSKGSETLSTTDKLAIVPGTATDCVDAETKCGVLNGCSTGAALMLMSDNLHWAAGALATLPTDAPYKVCHFLASRGTYELLAGDFRTCVAPPTYALSPAACVDGATAVTVQVSKGSETLSGTADRVAIVLGSATDCVGAALQCSILGGCSTAVGTFTKVVDDVHWAAGALATLPAGASFKVCYFVASRASYTLLDGTFSTCAATPTDPPVPTPVGCLDHVPAPYYVSLPSHTCVNDGEHASQGAGQVLLYGTKDECCNGLTRKERRECLKTEVLSEVYPDFEKGRCVAHTLRPAVVHPACGVTATGAMKSVAARFLKASLRADNELCCRKVYGGIDRAAVNRCVARRGVWFYVDGMGCVREDARADDPVVYSTVRTVGSLSACTGTYFPWVPAVMCDTFPCPALWTNRPDRDSIHCGVANDDCTKELCCTAPAAPPVVTCCGYRCTPHGLSARPNPELTLCPPGGCLPIHCCE